MKEEKLVTVKFYDTVLKAEIDMEVLKENGIECICNDGITTGLYPIFDEKERGIELMVFEADVERSKEILEEYHNADITESADE